MQNTGLPVLSDRPFRYFVQKITGELEYISIRLQVYCIIYTFVKYKLYSFSK